MSPKYVSREEVDQSFLEHEKEILLAQAKKENPENWTTWLKMIIGRLNKEMKEICLLASVYVSSDYYIAPKICRESSKREQC